MERFNIRSWTNYTDLMAEESFDFAELKNSHTVGSGELQ